MRKDAGMNFASIGGLESPADCLLPHQGCAVSATEHQRVVRFNAITLGAAFQSGH